MLNIDDLQKLLEILPTELQQALTHHSQQDHLIEVVLDLGRLPEARFPNQAQYLSQQVVTREQLQECLDRVGHFGADNRAGIEQTLHRISAIRNRKGEIIGLTCRVGRAIFGTIAMIRDLVETGQSILMLGRPGVGKTTALREIARVLADDFNKRVVIIDSSNEIAGDGDVPHPAIGRSRRMQVAHPELQHQVMIEAVENHMPEVIVIDEIGTELEALAARTIAERGVQLVGTAHGNQLENLIKNPTLSDLVGGIQSVTLGDEEARRRGSQKSVLERKAPPTFEIAVEMLERQRWVVHQNVTETIDSLLRGHQPVLQTRTLNDQGEVIITQEAPRAPISQQVSDPRRRSVGRVLPFSRQADQSPTQQGWIEGPPLGSSEKVTSAPLRLYAYGIGQQHLQASISTLNLPIILTRSLEDADAILTLKSQLRKHTSLSRMAETYQLPIYTIRANSLPQINTTLRQILGLEPDDLGLDESDLGHLTRRSAGDDIDALEEARIAIEQIVLPKKQPVDLLPRNSYVRKMQHELVEHYHLTSESLGQEPNRRLRIYPA